MMPPDPSCARPGCVCFRLTEAQVGEPLVVRHLQGEASLCLRLRELGLHEQAELSLMHRGRSVVALIQSGRLCLSREAAEAVLVAPPGAEADHHIPGLEA